MNRAQKELDRISAEAWSELAGDLQRTCTRVGQVGSAYVREHPLLAVGGSALIGALAISRVARPAAPPVAEPQPQPEAKETHGKQLSAHLTSTLMTLGRIWLAQTIAAASTANDGEDSSEAEGEEEEKREDDKDELSSQAEQAAEEHESVLTG